MANETGEGADLSAAQERTLAALLNLMIPPSGDGRLPGAADVGFLAYLVRENLVGWLRDGLLGIDQQLQDARRGEFSTLNGPEQAALFEAWRRRHARFFAELSTHVLQCYYQNDRVLKAIGLEARPPFPLGYVVQEGDLTLLEPVLERGKLYRG
jgi:hypothetical protein